MLSIIGENKLTEIYLLIDNQGKLYVDRLYRTLKSARNAVAGFKGAGYGGIEKRGVTIFAVNLAQGIVNAFTPKEPKPEKIKHNRVYRVLNEKGRQEGKTYRMKHYAEAHRDYLNRYRKHPVRLVTYDLQEVQE